VPAGAIPARALPPLGTLQLAATALLLLLLLLLVLRAPPLQQSRLRRLLLWAAGVRYMRHTPETQVRLRALAVEADARVLSQPLQHPL
jgi:hypothetical protein